FAKIREYPGQSWMVWPEGLLERSHRPLVSWSGLVAPSVVPQDGCDAAQRFRDVGVLRPEYLLPNGQHATEVCLGLVRFEQGVFDKPEQLEAASQGHAAGFSALFEHGQRPEKKRLRLARPILLGHKETQIAQVDANLHIITLKRSFPYEQRPPAESLGLR